MRAARFRPSIRLKLVALAAAIFGTVACAALASAAHAYLYYRYGASIERIALNGKGGRLKFIADAGGNKFCGLTATQSHIYWANNNDIGRADIDGSHVQRNWLQVHSAVCGIAADAKHVYWINKDGDVGRADVSGANVNEKFIKTSARALAAVAVSSSFIFWTDHEGIGRADIDGKNVKQDFAPANIATSLAVFGTHLYWNNLGPDFGGTTIGRAKLDGTAVNQKFIDLTPVDRHPCGLAVVDERMFFANWRPGNGGEDFSINFTGLTSNDVELTHFGHQFQCPASLAATPEGPTALRHAPRVHGRRLQALKEDS
jgi:hypothetical protein